jgi:hypothetical protein
MDIKEVEFECLDLIHLDKDTDQWWAPMNVVKNVKITFIWDVTPRSLVET